MSTFVMLPVKDATDMQAYVANPQDAPGSFPAIIVLQEAFGVNHHIRDIADRFAKEGYVAIAPELFHRTAPRGFEAPYTNFAAVQPHFAAITPDNMRNDLEATYHWLLARKDIDHARIAAIGFCMGGRVAFLANCFLPLKAAISFYGGSMHTITDLTAQLYAPQLFFWGGKDQHIRPEHVSAVIAAMREHSKQYINVEISYADHGFFCNERASYNPEAAAEAWELVKVFLRRKISAAENY